MRTLYDVIVAGGGAAGLAAACSAREAGAEDVLIIERDTEAGGILNQCIHNGFGLHYFKEELTGPEYAGRFMKRAERAGVSFLLDTTILSIKGHTITACNTADGVFFLTGKAIVLAMGCRERTRGAIAIPGDRPAGIFTAGTAQYYINIEGRMPGRRAVILGSGDIGLIMARRMALEGAKVLACIEIMPYCSGLNRNVVQCLNDYGIPLYLSHTVTDIKGLHRVERVTVSEVDKDRKPVPGTEKYFDCDTLLLSTGLIPENELTKNADIPLDSGTGGAVVYENMETLKEGIFSCGNVVHVHDLVDFVTVESQKAGVAAAEYAAGKRCPDGGKRILVKPGEHVTYVVPQAVRVHNTADCVDFSFRVNCMIGESEVQVKDEEKLLCRFMKKRMVPGEMEHITLSKILLEQMKGNELCISVQVKEERT